MTSRETPTDEPEDTPPSRSRAFFRAAQLASVGLELGVAVAIGGGVGWWLDRRFGTKPWLLLLFLLIGVAAGFKGVYAAARKAERELRASNGQEPPPSRPRDPRAKAGR
jgi:ATP synthase protein I